jgi:hypothetical protein
MRIFTLILLTALFCSCEESEYYIHIANNTEDTARGEPGQTVRYALAKDSGTILTIPPGGQAVHEVSFGLPYGIAFYEPEEGKPRNIGVRYTGDDYYEFYTLMGIPFSAINTLNFDAELNCGGYLSQKEPLTIFQQSVSPSDIKIYTQTPNFWATFKDEDGQEHPGVVAFTVEYDDHGQAERVVAEIR